MYDKNRVKHVGIGRCEIVADSKYQEQLIKYFKLKKYTDKNDIRNSFYYNNAVFDGNLRNGNQLCIKFFDSKENTEVSVQIAKYLISYLGNDGKQKYKFIFDNLKIRNITHSQVLFSKHLYSKIFVKLGKYKELHKYKNMYEFSKSYNNNDIVIDYRYENTIYTDNKYAELININDRFNDKMNEYKLSGSLDKFHKLKKYYNKFKAHNNDYFKNMNHYMEISFIQENRVLNADISRYTLTSNFIHRNLKHIDSDTELLDKYSYIKSNDRYEKVYNKEISLIDCDAIIQQDILLENIEASNKEDADKKSSLIGIIEDNLVKYADIDNTLFNCSESRLKYSLMAYEHTTKDFIEEQTCISEFKDFNSRYYR